MWPNWAYMDSPSTVRCWPFRVGFAGRVATTCGSGAGESGADKGEHRHRRREADAPDAAVRGGAVPGGQPVQRAGDGGP